MLGLYKFNVGCGRMGCIEGLFVAQASDVAEVVGKTINFGEILGKHSEVVILIKKEHFTLLSNDYDKIVWVATTIGEIGYNPIYYYDDQQEDEDENVD